jgi:RNA polymerase sigma factor (sigma-70 family)
MTHQRKKFGNTTELGELLDRLQAGDETARDELINKSFDRISRLARWQLNGFPKLRRKGLVDTADVSTEVMMYLREALGRVQIESGLHFVNFAATKIRWQLLELGEKHKKRLELEETNAAIDSDGAQRIEREGDGLEKVGGHNRKDMFRLKPDMDGITFDEWRAFHEAVDELPEGQNKAFMLRHYGDHSHAEIATILSITEDAAKKRYASAKKSLKRILSGLDVE